MLAKILYSIIHDSEILNEILVQDIKYKNSHSQTRKRVVGTLNLLYMIRLQLTESLWLRLKIKTHTFSSETTPPFWPLALRAQFQITIFT